MNTGLQVSLQDPNFISFRCIPRSYPAESYHKLALLILGGWVARILFSIMSHPIWFSQKVPTHGTSQLTERFSKLFFSVSKPFPCVATACKCPSFEGGISISGVWLNGLELRSLNKHSGPWTTFVLSTLPGEEPLNLFKTFHLTGSETRLRKWEAPAGD